MSTVAQMVTNVGKNAPSLSLWRDDVVNDLNNALQDLFEEADLEATSGVGTNPVLLTAAGQQTVNLPVNCVKPLELAWRIGGILAPVTYIDRDSYRRLSQVQSSGGDPAPGALRWNLWGGAIWLWPIPAADGTTGGDGELVLDYYKKPAALVNDNDVPDIPEQYHNLLEVYATAKAYAKAEEGQWMQAWMQEYERGKQQMAMERATTQRAMPAKIKPVRW
jgi:hypothetical protein